MLSSVSSFLIGRIPEISYFLSSAIMIFASDYVMELFLIRRLKRLNFLSRTLVFLLYGLLVLPGLTALGALILREMVLIPFKEWILLVMAVFFLCVGMLLSLRYNIKMRFRI